MRLGSQRCVAHHVNNISNTLSRVARGKVTRTHTHAHTNTHAHSHTHTHTAAAAAAAAAEHRHVPMCTHMHAYTHTHTFTCPLTLCAHTHTHTHIHSPRWAIHDTEPKHLHLHTILDAPTVKLAPNSEVTFVCVETVSLCELPRQIFVPTKKCSRFPLTMRSVAIGSDQPCCSTSRRIPRRANSGETVYFPVPVVTGACAVFPEFTTGTTGARAW